MAGRLELTWYGKDKPIHVEPRLLIEQKELSNTEHDKDTENMLIHGDNLLALKALLPKYAGKVKCVYIDPPYNTGSAFEQYDDNLEHSKWLNLMRPRLELLHQLLSDDGSIWISIDDDEQAYLKVLCDEIFGRSNFVCNIIWQKRYSPQNATQWISDSHDFIVVYAKKKLQWQPNLLPRTDAMNARYTNRDNDPRGPWKAADATAQAGHATKSQFYVLTSPNGTKHELPPGRCWLYTEKVMEEKIADNRIWFGETGNNVPAVKKFLSEVKQGISGQTIWLRDEVGDNQEAKKEAKAFDLESLFVTPKPERLVERILTLGSNSGDLVLDSFLGSGTTAAVAQKMNRRWIAVEFGDHCYTHCKKRMDMVIDGEQGGISKARNWQGGGGYRFYELAPTLIKEDSFGEQVINPEYDADMLAAAVALHEGFTYEPDDEKFWKQAFGNEKSYLFTTTRHLDDKYLDSIKADMQDGEYLIIACKSYDAGIEKAYPNITIKKIPQMLLSKCEFDKTYDLNIICPPEYEEGDDDE